MLHGLFPIVLQSTTIVLSAILGCYSRGHIQPGEGATNHVCTPTPHLALISSSTDQGAINCV